MNGHEPATKQDLADVRTELLGELRSQVGGLRTEFGSLRNEVSELRTEIRASEDRLIENMRDLQTESLKAFYGSSKPRR